MSTHKKFEEATLQPGKAIPLTKEEIQALYTVLDHLSDTIENLVPDAMPSTLQRQQASELKHELIIAAKMMGFTWDEEDCQGMHELFIVARAGKKKCLLCGREIWPETDRLQIKESA